jgi:hypothetical protein
MTEEHERQESQNDHDRIVAAATAAATATIERAEAVGYSRKINAVLAIATIMAVSYGVGMTVSSLTVGASMRADITRIDAMGSEKTKEALTAINELKTKYEANIKSIDNNLAEIKKMVLDHLLVDKRLTKE